MTFTDGMPMTLGRRIRWALLVFLLGLSFLGTFVGVTEYVTANYGELNAGFQGMIAGFVAVITVLMAFAVHRAVSTDIALTPRLVWLIVYLIIAAISICFAFGFWWRFMEARTATNIAVAADTVRIEQGLKTADRQLLGIRDSMTRLAQRSAAQSTREADSGGTCGDQSPSGAGPRANLRRRHADLFSQAATDLNARLAPIRTGIGESLVAIAATNERSLTVGSNERVRILTQNREQLTTLSQAVNELREDQQLRATIDTFAGLAPRYGRRLGFTDPLTNAVFTCQDEVIQNALIGAERAFKGLAPLPPPTFRIYERSEAVLEAFRRLGRTFFGSFFAEDPTEPPGERLGPRDFVPLVIAIVVDLGVLAISIDRPHNGEKTPLQRRIAVYLDRKGRQRERRRRDEERAAHYFEARNALSRETFGGLDTVLVDYEGRYCFLLASEISEPGQRAKLTAMRNALSVCGNPKLKAIEEFLARRGRKWDVRARGALHLQNGSLWDNGSKFQWFGIIEPDGLEKICAILDRIDTHRRDADDPLVQGVPPRTRLLGPEAREEAALREMERIAGEERAREAEVRAQAAREQQDRRMEALRQNLNDVERAKAAARLAESEREREEAREREAHAHRDAERARRKADKVQNVIQREEDAARKVETAEQHLHEAKTEREFARVDREMRQMRQDAQHAKDAPLSPPPPPDQPERRDYEPRREERPPRPRPTRRRSWSFFGQWR